MQERLFLFRELICKDVDWTGLGMPAYSCFNAFFERIWAEAVADPPKLVTVSDSLLEDSASAAPLPSAPAMDVSGERAGYAVPPPAPPFSASGGSSALSAAAAEAKQEDLTGLGVDTLWRVTLTSLNKEVADSATLDLLSVSMLLLLLFWWWWCCRC